MVDKLQEQKSLATISKFVTNIARSAVKLNETIHETALLCMKHAQDYGDANNTAARLVDALPLSHRRSLLIAWFANFSPIGIGKDGKTGKMKGHLTGKAEDRVWNIEAAKATPFYAMPDAEREPDVPTFESIHSNVVAFLKRIEKKADAIPNVEEKAKAFGEIEKLKAAVAA